MAICYKAIENWYTWSFNSIFKNQGYMIFLNVNLITFACRFDEKRNLDNFFPLLHFCKHPNAYNSIWELKHKFIL